MDILILVVNTLSQILVLLVFASVILSFFITSLLNYAFGVILSWFYNPAEYGMLGIAQSLLLLIALVVGSGFTWTVTQDIAANGLAEATRLRFRSEVCLPTPIFFMFNRGKSLPRPHQAHVEVKESKLSINLKPCFPIPPTQPNALAVGPMKPLQGPTPFKQPKSP